MNKKLLVSVFLFFFVYSLILISQEESKEKKIWEDERISITVDKVERLDSISSQDKKIRAQLYYVPKDWDIVLIYLTIVQIKDKDVEISPPAVDMIYSSYVTYPESKLSQCTHLLNTEGHGYIAEIGFFQFYKPSGNLRYLKEVKGYHEKLLGARGILAFAMPKDANPVQMKYIYPYWEEPTKPKEKKYGQIDIDLSHIQ